MKSPESPDRSARDERVVKLLLPLPVIRSMDHLLVEGTGGFTTRNEFVREAIESYILELTHEAAPPEPVVLASRRSKLAPAPTLVDPVAEELFREDTADQPAADVSLDATAFSTLPPDIPLVSGRALITPEPLFGMHNRDYPSLWAASRLADYLTAGPVSFDKFAERATEDAWVFANSLRSLEAGSGQKLTALFPTNYDKRQTASGAFREFAIGSAAKSVEGVRAAGPLFLWHVVDCELRDREIFVGLTASGYDLLKSLVGLTVASPHAPEYARIFITHLKEHALADWWGFRLVLSVVAGQPTRTELVGAFAAARPDWSDSVAATNAQGYVARAREWGLVVPKVVDGRYELTDFGSEVAKEEAAR